MGCKQTKDEAKPAVKPAVIAPAVMSNAVKIFIKTKTPTVEIGTGGVLTIEVGDKTTIADVKNMIKDKAGIPLDQQSLVYYSSSLIYSKLEDDHTLAESGIKSGIKKYTLELQLPVAEAVPQTASSVRPPFTTALAATTAPGPETTTKTTATATNPPAKNAGTTSVPAFNATSLSKERARTSGLQSAYGNLE